MSDLKLAATRLRNLTAMTTPGPWRESQTTNGMRFSALVSDRRHPDRMPGGGWDYDDSYGGCLIAESLMSGDRAYIAAVNPKVGALLADLLDAVAAEDPIAVGLHARGLAQHLTTPQPARTPRPAAQTAEKER